MLGCGMMTCICNIHATDIIRERIYTVACSEYLLSSFSFMRWDALGHLLMYANVQAGARVLVMEQSLGLVTAAVVSRLGGTSLLTNTTLYADIL